MSNSRDYNYYDKWTFLFPLYSLSSIFSMSVLAVLFRVVLNNKNSKKPYDQLNKRQTCLKLFINGLVDLMVQTSKFLLFEFEYEKIKNLAKVQYRLHGVPVHLFVLQYLFIMLLSILAMSLLSFWNVFFVESEVDACNELLDCFPMYRDNLTPIDINPIIDCTQHTVNENTTIICFQVVFKYSEGLGEAGGFLFLMQVIINIVIYVVVSIFRVVLKATKVANERNITRKRTMSEVGKKLPFVVMCQY